MNENKNINWFSRILIIILGLFIGSMIFYNFYIKEIGNITNGLIFLICLLIIVLLSEIFDDLSFGKLLSLKKNVTEKKEEIKELKVEKQSLLNLIVTNLNFQNQSQSVGFSATDVKDLIGIIKADPEKVKEADKEKEEELEKITKERASRNRVDFRKLERIGFDKYIKENDFDKYILNEQIQVDSKDPISSFNPVFDGYLNTDNSEIFIEVKLQRAGLMFRETIYQRLMNIYFYRKLKNSNAYLQLILIELPEDKSNNRIRNTEEKIKKDFLPAFETGLLKIEYYKLNENEEKLVYGQE